MVDFYVGISLPFSVEYVLCPYSLSFLSTTHQLHLLRHHSSLAPPLQCHHLSLTTISSPLSPSVLLSHNPVST